MRPTSAHPPKRLGLRVIASPWVLLPLAGGAGAVLAGLAFIGVGGGLGGGLLIAVGLGSLAVGAGALAMRWLAGPDRRAGHAVADQLTAEAGTDRGRLDQLQVRLASDFDRRDDRALAGLRELDRRFHELLAEDFKRGTAQKVPPEVASQLRELIHASVGTLERIADLQDTLRRVVTPEAKARVHETRRMLIDEVESNVDQLVRALDDLHTLGLDRENPRARLARLRGDLDKSLAVARRIDQRLADFDRGFDESREVE